MKKVLSLLICFLLITNLSVAQEESYYKVRFLGLNTRVNPRLLEEDESPDMSNFTLEETGAITERDVFGKYNASSGILGNNPITGLFKFYTTSNKFFVATSGEKIVSGTAGAFDTDITNTGINISSGTFFDACTFNNLLYLFNESVQTQVWTGSGATTTVTTPPDTNARYCAVHKSRIWAVGSNSLPYRLYYSSLSDGDDWSNVAAATGGSEDLPDLTQTITGLKSWGGILYIFTETNIFVLLGSTPNNFKLIKTNSDVGAIAPRSIKVTDEGIIFLARTGVFKFNGSRSFKLTDEIQSIINGISKTRIKNAAGLWDGQGKYWLSYADSTSDTNNKIIIYDTLLKEWFPYDGMSINYFVRAFGGTDRGELYGGSSLSDGTVWLLQEASGTETIVHETKSSFDTGQTFNTIVIGTEVSPRVLLFPVSEELPTDSDCKLLLHFDGLNGGTTFTDSSGKGHNFVQQRGDAELDTSRRKVGTANLRLDGDDSINIGDDPDFDWGAGDWYWGVWVNTDTFTATGMLWSHGSAGNVTNIFLRENAMSGQWSAAGGVKVDLKASPLTWNTNEWHHIAFVRSGDDFGLYIDGLQQDYDTYDAALGDGDTNVFIGDDSSETGSFYNGWMDELKYTKSNIVNGSPNSSLTDQIDYPPRSTGGLLHSANLNINASGQSALGTITWSESLPLNTDIQFTTRTGATDDTVTFTGWQVWASSSSVTISTVTDNTAWESSDSINFTIGSHSVQPRRILFYEAEDEPDPDSIKFTVGGVASTNDFAFSTVAGVNLSTYTFGSFWLKSPTTGSSVRIFLNEVSGNVVDLVTNSTVIVTANTVMANVWEKHFFPLSSYTNADIDDIKFVGIQYLGEGSGDIYLGWTEAYDFFDSGDIITSTPNDYIQYRAMLGTANTFISPVLTSVTLEYTPSIGDEEYSLSSNYKTKPIGFEKPMKNKQFFTMFLEAATPTNEATIEVDFDIDNGAKTGTLTFDLDETPNTVRMKEHFSGSTFGKLMQLNIKNTDRDSKITVRALEIRKKTEGFTDD